MICLLWNPCPSWPLRVCLRCTRPSGPGPPPPSGTRQQRPRSTLLAQSLLRQVAVRTLFEQRLSPLAARYASETFGPGAVDDRLRSDTFAWVDRSLRTVHRSVEILEMLDKAGLPYVVTKGPGVAACYPVITDRPFSDLDILVARGDFQKALAVIGRAGYQEDAVSQQPWPYFDRSCREAINLKRPDGGSVDLHHHIPPWLWGKRLLFPGFLERSQVRRLFGADLRVASAEDNLLVTALHVVSDRNQPGRTLLTWRDVAQLAGVADPAVAAELALQAGLAGWLLAILAALPTPLRPAPLLSRLAARPAVPRPAHVVLLCSVAVSRMGVRSSQPLRLPIPAGIAYLAGMIARGGSGRNGPRNHGTRTRRRALRTRLL